MPLQISAFNLWVGCPVQIRARMEDMIGETTNCKCIPTVLQYHTVTNQIHSLPYSTRLLRLVHIGHIISTMVFT